MNENQGTGDGLVWTALEYETKEHSRDWFWAFGIIVATSSVAAIIFGDYFFAALLVLSGILLGFFSTQKPNTVQYELNSHGLKIGSRLFPYENIKSFWVRSGNLGNSASLEEKIGLKPALFINSERAFMPMISVPIDDDMAEEVHSIMLANNIAEEEMKESASERIMEALGF